MCLVRESNEEIEKLQKEEALERMKMLKIFEQARKEFQYENKLNYSERGLLWWLDEEEEQMIREWEEQTGNMVYHVIKNHMEFGLCYCLLFVSRKQAEWQRDREDLQEGYPFVYVMNADCPKCSEYGTIGVKPFFGGVRRTA